MNRTCTHCHNDFQTPRPQARYCSDACRTRAKRQRAAARAAASPAAEPTPACGRSGAAARAWLAAHDIDAENTPAAADLLLVADHLDLVTVDGRSHLVAALLRQAAALRHEVQASAWELPEDPPAAEPDPPERRPFDVGWL